MAVTAIHHIPITDTASIGQSPDWQIQDSLYSKDEKTCRESLSMFSSSSSRTFLSRCESHSPGYTNVYSASNSQTEPSKKTPESTDVSDEDRALAAKPYLAEKPVMRKSRAGVYVMDKNPTEREQEKPADRAYEGSFRITSEGLHDTTTKNEDYSSQKKWNLAGDGFNFTYDKSFNFTYDKSNLSSYSLPLSEKLKRDQNNQLLTSKLTSGDYDLQSQSCNYEFIKQKYKLDSLDSKTDSDDVEGKSSHKQPYQPSFPATIAQNLEFSELALRIRSSIRSDFLSNELRPAPAPAPTPCSDKMVDETRRTLRTIDDILKEHGISISSSAVNNENDWKGNSLSQAESINVSQNNETLSTSTETINKTKTEPETSSTAKDSSSLPGNTSKDSKEHIFSYLDDTNLASSSASFKLNLSQNNETSKNQSTGENDSLRRFGSSVDYSLTGGPGKYSLAAKTNFGRYDYGKSATQFAGDTPVVSAAAFSSMDSKKSEDQTSATRPLSKNMSQPLSKNMTQPLSKNMTQPPSKAVEGSQVDLIKPDDARLARGASFELIRSIGSATDALEYSLSNERQRLRKLDTMITSTPFLSSTTKLPKPVSTRFMSPERDYTSYITSDLLERKIYSTTTFPSTSYGSGLAHRNSWTNNVDHRSTTNILGKSVSAPGVWGVGFQTTNWFGPSVENKWSYWPYLSKRDYNVQYNNSTYNPQPAEKATSQKNFNKNQKKTPVNQKNECQPKKNYKGAPGAAEYSSNSSNHLQSFPCSSFFAGILSDKDDSQKQKGNAGKPAPKKTAATKKGANTSNSKNTPSLYSKLCFVQDLNRLWQETLNGKTSTEKPPQKTQKYSNHKPYLPLQEKKEQKCQTSNGTNELINKNHGQLSSRHNQNSRKAEGLSAKSGKLGGYESDYSFMPSQSIWGLYSTEPNRATQESNKKSANSQAKQKSKITPSTNSSHGAKMPKSILKQSSQTSTGNTTRSQSEVATASKSYNLPPSQLPYLSYYNYSPLDVYSMGQSSSLKPAKKKEPSNKQKEAFENSLTLKPCFRF